MEDYIVDNKKRVARFILLWFKISVDAFLNCKTIWVFLDELIDLMEKDNLKHDNHFETELTSLRNIKETKEQYVYFFHPIKFFIHSHFFTKVTM